MPFDAQAPAEVTTRDRVIMLRDFLARLPPEKFMMQEWESGCGTAACIAGWNGMLMHDRFPNAPWERQSENEAWVDRMAASLGLDDGAGRDLFLPCGIGLLEGVEVARAVAVLDYYLATGKIDWSAAT